MNKKHPAWGGWRPGAGRKRAVPPEPDRRSRSVYCTKAEYIKIRVFLASIRAGIYLTPDRLEEVAEATHAGHRNTTTGDIMKYLLTATQSKP